MEKPRLFHGATLTAKQLRDAGIKTKLPKPEQYHPACVVEFEGFEYQISAPKRMSGCGQTQFFSIWRRWA